MADVDLCRIEPLQQRFPAVRVYQDWRELLEREHKNIDSVNVSIPDHMHCLVAMAAMKRDKAVYVEKPLCNTLHETRLLTEYARKRGLTTQMGIQVSSTRPQLYGEALVRSGIVGKIKEVHTFSNKSWGDDKPLEVKGERCRHRSRGTTTSASTTPRPFIQKAYHPGEWRRRIGFGTGTLGDMGCHIYSPPYRALKLTSPISVMAAGPAPTADNWAVKARVKLTYPGTEFTAGDTVDVWWYDGGELPPDAIREPVGTRFPAQGSVRRGHDRHAGPAARQRPGVRRRIERAATGDRRAGARPLRRVHRRGARRQQDEVFGQPRLRRTAHRSRADRQRRRAFPRRDPGVQRQVVVVPEAQGSQRIPDAELSKRVGNKGVGTGDWGLGTGDVQPG